MADVELSESWVAAGEVASLQAKVRQFYQKHKMRVIGEQAGEVHARQGSPWLAWLFGLLRVAQPQWLPKRAFVKLRRAENGVTVRANIEDGETRLKPGPDLRDKYQAYFQW